MTNAPCAVSGTMTRGEQAMSGTQKITLQPAFVLHRRPYRNSSVLAEVLTLEYGRIGLVARGARSARARSSGILQAFQPLLVSCTGRGELYTLVAAEAGAPALGLAGKSMISGFYLNELLMRLLHRHDPHESLFHVYADTLAGLADMAPVTDSAVADSGAIEGTASDTMDLGRERILRHFETRMLQELGYGLLLDRDAHSGDAVREDGRYSYHPELGPVALEASESAGIPVSGRTLLALHEGCCDNAACLREAKHLMRAVLDHHLGDRPLKSRNLFASMTAASY